jgi:hypothetical protein
MDHQSQFELHPKSYHCYGTVDYECEENHRSIRGVSKNHLEGRTDSDVLFLEFAVQTNIDRVPKNVDYFYPHLEIFKCSFCMISKITSEDLKQMPNLNCIYLGHNQLKYVPGDLFKHNPNMKFIGMEANQIQSIGPGLFDNLPHLWFMYFNNDCLHKQLGHYGNMQDYIADVYQHCVKARRSSDEIEISTASYNPIASPKKTKSLPKVWKDCEEKYRMPLYASTRPL